MAFKRSADYGGEDANGSYHAQGRHQKKRRTYTEEDAKLAKIYENLASEEDQVRVKAAIDLVHTCVALNDNEGDGSTDTLSKIQNRLIRGLCSSRKGARIGFSLAFTEFLGVTLGLLSGESFHRGVTDLIAIIEQQTKAEGGASRQEKRDYLIGRVFALNCVVRSQVLFKDQEHAQSLPAVIRELCELSKKSSSSWSKEECGLVCYQAVCLLVRQLPKASETAEKGLETMQGLGALKTPEGVIIWLELSKHMEHVNFPAKVWHKDDPLHAKEIATVSKILHSVKLSDDDDTKETSGARQVAPHFAWKIILQHVMTLPDKASKKKRKKEKEQKDSAEQVENKVFKQFWLEAVDNMFFAATASPEKKAVGFQVFENFVATAPVSMLSQGFSDKLMKCLINQSANAQRYLHTIAKRLLDAIVARATADGQAAPIIFAALIKDNGMLAFDKLTKTETVATIATQSSESAQLAILSVYEMLITQQSPAAKQQEVDARFNLIGDQLVSLAKIHIKSQTAPCSWTAWLDKVFQIIGALGFAIEPNDGLKEALSQPLSSKIQESFRTKFASCLANLLNATSPIDDKTKQVCNVDLAINKATGHFQRCNALLRDVGFVTLAQAESGVLELCDRVVELQNNMKSISSKKGKDAKKKSTGGEDVEMKDNETDDEEKHAMQKTAMNLLANMTLFQAYNGEADAFSMLQDFVDIHETLGTANGDPSGLPAEAVASIVEIILSFCSQSTPLHKRVADLAFRGLSSVLTPEALNSMLEVLEQKEGLAGQQALFGDAAEEINSAESANEHTDEAESTTIGEEDEEDAEDHAELLDTTSFEIIDVDDEDSDVELIDGELVEHGQNGNDDTAEDDSSETSSTSSSDNDNDDDDEDDTPDQELTDFEAKLASILRHPNSTSKTNDNADDDDDDDAASISTDSTMNSSQMEELDKHLIAIFRERSKASHGNVNGAHNTSGSSSTDPKQTKAQTQRRAKENIIAFKNRVFDLLELYLSSETKHRVGNGDGYKSAMALNALLPLLQCLRGSRSSQIQARASRVLLDVFIGTAKKRKAWPAVDVSLGFDEGEGITEEIAAAVPVPAPATINAWALLRQTLDETTLFASREHAKAGSRACLFLARCLLVSGANSGYNSDSNNISAQQIRSKIAGVYSAAHSMALARAAGGAPADEGKEVGKKKKKKGKKAGLDEDGNGNEDGKGKEEVRLPDWQAAVWSEWEEFERQTRK